MDWLWIAALAWILLAVPLALVTGRYLTRADERNAQLYSRSESARETPTDEPGPDSARDMPQPAPRRRRELTSALLIVRSFHVRGRDRPAPEPDPENGTARLPGTSRRRSRTTPHWR